MPTLLQKRIKTSISKRRLKKLYKKEKQIRFGIDMSVPNGDKNTCTLITRIGPGIRGVSVDWFGADEIDNGWFAEL